jgi:hypothetical protein
MTDNRTIILPERNWWYYLLHLVIVLGIFSGCILISGIFNSPLFLIILLLSFAFMISFVLLGVYITISGNRRVNSLVNQQFPQDLDPSIQDHDGFIVNHSLGFFNTLPYSGFDILIPFFIERKYPFKVYHCYNPDEFVSVLKNEKVKFLWIFGHGWKGGITFKWAHFLAKSRTRMSYNRIYNELKNSPRKKFVGQFHCSHIDTTEPDNLSAPELLLDVSDSSYYYLTNTKMNVISIWFAIRNCITDVKRTGIL